MPELQKTTEGLKKMNSSTPISVKRQNHFLFPLILLLSGGTKFTPRRWYHFLFPLILLLLGCYTLLFWNCSTEEPKKDTVDLNNICDRYVDLHKRLYKKLYYECSVDPLFAFDVHRRDIDERIQAQSDQAREMCLAKLDEFKKAINRKTIGFDGEKASEYIRKAEELLSKNCNEVRRNSVLIDIVETIVLVLGKDVFYGRLQEGQECYIENECAAGLYCGGKSCPGVCTSLGKEGAPCERHDECEAKLVCYSERCTTIAETFGCRRNSDCPPPKKCLDGQCISFKQEGEYCETHQECDFLCDLQEKRCISYDFVPNGKSCEKTGDKLRLCISGTCVFKQGEHICEPYEKENESCLTQRKTCDIGLFCSDEGICVRTPKEGEKCYKERCGYGLYCKDGICKRKKETGEACISSDECKTGLCSEGRCFDIRQNVLQCVKHSDCINWNCLNNRCCRSL